MRDIIRAELGSLRYAGYWLYSVVSFDGEPPDVLVDCDPVDPACNLPSLSRVTMMPGIDGITSKPPAGTECTVVFLNHDPSQPRIVGVGSLGVNPVARVGDQVTVFVPPLMPIAGVDVLGIPFVAVVTIASPITGTIVQGSGKVFTG